MNEKIETLYPRINITSEFFPFAFGLGNQYGYPYRNDSIVELKFFRDQFFFDKGVHTQTEIELEKCTSKHFMAIIKEEFDAAYIDGYYCPKNYSDIYVEGSFISNNLTSISFQVFKCDYEKFPQKCGTKEEIDKTIVESVLNYNIFYIGNYISIGNYSNPLKPLVINKRKFLQRNNRKITNFYLQENFLITDNAIFSTN